MAPSTWTSRVPCAQPWLAGGRVNRGGKEQHVSGTFVLWEHGHATDACVSEQNVSFCVADIEALVPTPHSPSRPQLKWTDLKSHRESCDHCPEQPTRYETAAARLGETQGTTGASGAGVSPWLRPGPRAACGKLLGSPRCSEGRASPAVPKSPLVYFLGGVFAPFPHRGARGSGWAPTEGVAAAPSVTGTGGEPDTGARAHRIRSSPTHTSMSNE